MKKDAVIWVRTVYGHNVIRQQRVHLSGMAYYYLDSVTCWMTHRIDILFK